jgi:hypothetical protein
LEERRARGDLFIESIDSGPVIDVSPPIGATAAGS